MKTLSLLLVGLCATTVLPSCATAIRGTNDKLIIETIPDGARVTTDRKMGKNEDGTIRYAGCEATPCTIRMPRRSEFLMTVEKEGYAPYEIGVTNGLKKEALRSNLATSGTVGVAMGVTTAVAFAGVASGGTGALVAGGAAVAGITAGAALGATLLVDGPSGALLNLQPNPIVLEMAPAGTDIPEHPGAVAIREKRMRKAEKKASK